MRTIKFIGKRIDNKGWVYGYYRKNSFYNKLGDNPLLIYEKHFIGSFDNLSLIDNLFEQVEVHPESVGQFTGLKDRNGVEIYEGNEIGTNYFGDEAESLGKVYYCDERLAFVIGKHNLLSDFDFNDLEIIN